MLVDCFLSIPGNPAWAGVSCEMIARDGSAAAELMPQDTRSAVVICSRSDPFLFSCVVQDDGAWIFSCCASDLKSAEMSVV